MPETAQIRGADALEAAILELQRDFLMTGPLRGRLPADIRADIVRVFTQVLTRAIAAGDGRELIQFVEAVVWEARKLGVMPSVFLGWVDHYIALSQRQLTAAEWAVAGPLLLSVRQHIERLQN